MDRDLIDYLNARFGETSQRIASLREEVSGLRKEFELFRVDTARRFEKVEEEVYQSNVAYRGLSHLVSLFGEGLVGLDDRLQVFRAENQVPKDRDPLEIIRKHYGKTQASG